MNRNEYMKKYMLKRYHERKAKAIDFLGGKCKVCGSKEKLEFDHIKPDTKSFTIGKKLSSVSEKKLMDELNKCQLLCNEHHKEKTLRDSGTVSARKTHGTLSSYRYCKCKLCKKAKSDYMKEYMKRHRKNTPIVQ